MFFVSPASQPLLNDYIVLFFSGMLTEFNDRGLEVWFRRGLLFFFIDEFLQGTLQLLYRRQRYPILR